MHNFILVFSTVLLISSAVWANEMPQEWSACETSADCGVVSSDCGPSISVNVNYKTAVREEICKTENCSGKGCDASAIQAYVAICKNGQCVPDYTAKPPPQPEVNFQLKDLEFRCPADYPDCEAKGGVIPKEALEKGWWLSR